MSEKPIVRGVLPALKLVFWRFLLVLLAAAELVGCGGGRPAFPTAKVGGTVMFQGKPVQEGSVSIIPQGPGQTASANIEQGKYQIANAPKGQVKVTVNVIAETGKMDTSYSQPIPEKASVAPAKYREGVLMEITDDNPALNFDLKADDK